jgi:two-component system response regulator RegX3
MQAPPEEHQQDSAPPGYRIALLEDDLLVAELLGIAFAEAGWEHRHFTTVAGISKVIRHTPFDLLMLDWMLPDGEADSVIRLAREHCGWELPILIVSVDGDEQRIVHALGLGADDYVVKPLRLSEVRARVSALLRRSRATGGETLTLGRYQIDRDASLFRIDGKPVDLTVMEYELASYLFLHPDELLSRERLLLDVWKRNPEVDTRTVDAHIGRLRKKLGLNPKSGVRLNTLRGYGYRFEILKEAI